MSADQAWFPAAIGIGSNQQDPAKQIHRALAALHELPDTRFMAHSASYRNPPMGPVEQPDFVNAVAVLLTRLSPRTLLEALQSIEAAQGRERDDVPRWGPRIIDLDILTYGQQVIRETDLEIPHSGISQRNFVLLPLREICPFLSVPGLGSVSRLAAMIDGEALEVIPDRA